MKANVQALILHAWNQRISYGWYQWLRKEMDKKGFHSVTPDLPTFHTKLPDLKKEIRTAEGSISITENSVIVGHSLGALLAMRIAERRRFQKLILIAGWDFDTLTEEYKSFWPNKINHNRIKENVRHIYCLSSDNDPFITSYHAEQMTKRLGGVYVFIKGAGHFTAYDGINEIPMLQTII